MSTCDDGSYGLISETESESLVRLQHKLPYLRRHNGSDFDSPFALGGSGRLLEYNTS